MQYEPIWAGLIFVNSNLLEVLIQKFGVLVQKILRSINHCFSIFSRGY